MTLGKRQLGLGIGAGLIALGLTAAVFASPQNTNGGGPPFMGRRGGGPMGLLGGPGLRMIAQRLGLTDAQKQQIESIVQSHRDEFKGLGDRMAQARQALDAAIAADPVNDAAVRDASAAVAAVQADMAVTRAHIRSEVFQVLTPDQQAQARQMQANAMQRMQKMRDRIQQRLGGQQP